MKSDLELYIESFAPPGMDSWIDNNRETFIAQHGPNEYEAFLLSAAWTMYRRIYRDPAVMAQ